MSDYKDGFQDGYKFAREEIMEKLAEHIHTTFLKMIMTQTLSQKLQMPSMLNQTMATLKSMTKKFVM